MLGSHSYEHQRPCAIINRDHGYLLQGLELHYITSPVNLSRAVFITCSQLKTLNIPVKTVREKIVVLVIASYYLQDLGSLWCNAAWVSTCIYLRDGHYHMHPLRGRGAAGLLDQDWLALAHPLMDPTYSSFSTPEHGTYLSTTSHQA